MALQNISLSISISIIFLCLVSGHFTSLHADPNHNNHVQAYGYGFQADPSHISTTIEDKNEFENSINHENGIFVVRKFGKEGRVLASAKTISVEAFGAKGDGSDATEAFKKAWSEACSSTGAVLLVAQKSYLLKPITFTGPCKSVLTMQISGTIEASGSRSDYNSDRGHWLLFDNVQNLVVEGGGTINGNGMIWWQNSCKINKALALTFYKSENIKVNNLKIKNAQRIHVSFEGCVNVQASNLVVSSPEKSPNTDGIHVTNTQNIQISSCIIGTGDDCISIVSGSQKVQATDITCGPGHGISIGSLGSGKSEAHVSDVVVNGAKLSEFSCSSEKCGVPKHQRNESASNATITFDCSKNYPCQGIVLQDVNITPGKASCNNVKLSKSGVVSPQCP
ncbi:hypothetical protein LOK49_LG10G02924 [Camellia lanceoleosa]|uniref:Uncharacterized protein n=1 Tax=Camellia lanceoleosa TaxID=1840588 RepID=A0ACC0GDF1_9ERIC|nr:hypothetical protein LOK49_LG10G02924 [Camellia lanceoleosa]